MGPFLSTWLAQVEHWSPSLISFVLSASLVAGMALAAPAGMLLDYARAAAGDADGGVRRDPGGHAGDDRGAWVLAG